MSPPQPSPTSLMDALSIHDEMPKPVADEELEAFRRQWKAEVTTRRPAEQQPSTSTLDQASPSTSPSKAKPIQIAYNRNLSPSSTASSLSPVKSPKWAAQGTSPRSPTRPTRPGAASNGRISASPEKPIPFPMRNRERGSALSMYTRAVEAEQAGQLNDALHLYRKAFRADDNVDKLYASAMKQQLQPSSQLGHTPEPEEEVQALTPADIVDPSAPEIQPYSFTRHVQVHPDYERTRRAVSRLTALITARVGVVPEDHEGDYDAAAEFKPEEDAPIPLALLPPELLEHILLRLDVAGLEAFGTTCWRARVITAHSGVWKRLVERIYRPPMIDAGIQIEDIVGRHSGEWRTTLVEEERLRLDGCYISVCHYIRPGAGEQWVTITHMVTYHRFLRFYPDGSVISFLTTDHPSEVVPILNQDLRAKGLHLGQWQLFHDVNDKGKKRTRVLISQLFEPGGSGRYEFAMELSLRETNRGRWNKLDLNQYSSIQLDTGEVLGLSLKHQKPFYFSKVRSFQHAF